ncbi:response regulator [Vibrio lamellibrachiae]|uniref:response regulator n=1 Tax=Vibrio lamellibrachiae TaxID=2910253 RepID=UPI003D11A9E2
MESKNHTIVVVDDDADIRGLLTDYLGDNGYNVKTAEDSTKLDQILQYQAIDLVILDLMLPGEDGFSICRRLTVNSDIPILMLTATGDDINRIIGLEMGADDYVSKPFNPRELLARIKAILRRYNKTAQANHTEQNLPLPSTLYALKFGNWILDQEARELVDELGTVHPMTSYDFTLLSMFLKNPNAELSRDVLYDATKGREHSPLDRSLDVHISRLRNRIEPNPKNPIYIKTIRGVGYIFTANVETGARDFLLSTMS